MREASALTALLVVTAACPAAVIVDASTLPSRSATPTVEQVLAYEVFHDVGKSGLDFRVKPEQGFLPKLELGFGTALARDLNLDVSSSAGVGGVPDFSRLDREFGTFDPSLWHRHSVNLGWSFSPAKPVRISLGAYGRLSGNDEDPLGTQETGQSVTLNLQAAQRTKVTTRLGADQGYAGFELGRSKLWADFGLEQSFKGSPITLSTTAGYSAEDRYGPRSTTTQVEERAEARVNWPLNRDTKVSLGPAWSQAGDAAGRARADEQKVVSTLDHRFSEDTSVNVQGEVGSTMRYQMGRLAEETERLALQTTLSHRFDGSTTVRLASEVRQEDRQPGFGADSTDRRLSLKTTLDHRFLSDATLRLESEVRRQERTTGTSLTTTDAFRVKIGPRFTIDDFLNARFDYLFQAERPSSVLGWLEPSHSLNLSLGGDW